MTAPTEKSAKILAEEIVREYAYGYAAELSPEVKKHIEGIASWITQYAEEKPHDHNTKTCETCRSISNYAEQQYVAYEKKAAEAKRDALSEWESLTKIAEKQARAEALEEAAKVAQSYLMIGAQMNPQFPQLAKNLAEQIRSLQGVPKA